MTGEPAPLAVCGPHRLRVGDLARLTGKTVRALHLYEELGLLKPTERSKGGYRLYGVDAVERVGWIGKLQQLGFSLTELQEFSHSLETSHRGPLAMLRVRAIFEEKLRETRENINKLNALEQDLQQSLAYLEGCFGCEPGAEPSTCSACGRTHEVPPPILVSGIHWP
ncbi:MAG TPA: MerR family transcriptional regulator [Polyangia bacterium]|jgi:DNA-binding transcriptional MerR regulator